MDTPRKSPSDRQAMRERQRALRRALGPVVRSRLTMIEEMARGRRVLDIGVVSHDLNEFRSPTALHPRVAKVARECLGVDILAEECRVLAAEGYNIRCHDVLSAPLPDKFELIICGELIEHLDRPGDLLGACAAMLAPGGRVVVTTPNPYYLARVIRELRSRTRENLDHVTLVPPFGFATLCERHGLRLERYHYSRYRPASPAENGWVSYLAKVALGWILPPLGFKGAACDTLIFVAAAADRS